MTLDPPADADPETAGAWAYERLHVPALFGQWADPVLDAAAVGTGHAVLDVACGTGIVARTAVGRVGPTGRVTGCDIDPGMLAVAEQIEPAVTWLSADAASLPFEDADFDAAVCQFGLMFVGNRGAAIGELLRTVRPGGCVTVAVWGGLDTMPAFSTSVDLLQRRAGDDAANALRAPFVLGEADDLLGAFDDTDLNADLRLETVAGTARFPSVRAMVEADLRGWLPLLGVHLDEPLIADILAEADQVLADHVRADGTMQFPVHAHLATATRR